MMSTQFRTAWPALDQSVLREAEQTYCDHFAASRGGCIVVEASGIAGAIAALAALRSGCTAIVAPRRRFKHMLDVLEGLGLPSGSGEEPLLLKSAVGVAAVQVVAPDSWAPFSLNTMPELVFATSGSTGAPKLVPFTNGQVEFIEGAVMDRIPYASTDVIGLGLPTSFDYGFYQVLFALNNEAAICEFNGVTFPQEALRAIQDNSCTVLPITPQYGSQLARLANTSNVKFDSVRLLTSTGAHLGPETIARLSEAFPNAQIVPMYGLTECKRVAISSAQLFDLDPVSVGHPLTGTEVHIIDESGERADRGEAWVTGPHVSRRFLGQHDDWDPNAAQFMLPTGDEVSIGRHGGLLVHGRICSDFVKFNDERLPLLPIEETLTSAAQASVRMTPVMVEGLVRHFDIEIDAGSPVTEREIRVAVQKVHGTALARSLRITLVPHIDLNDNGKVTR